MSYSHPNVVRSLGGLNGSTSYAKSTRFSAGMVGRMSTDTSIHAATRAAHLASERAKKNVERAQKLEEAFKEEQAKAEELASKLQHRKERILKRQRKQQASVAATTRIQRFFRRQKLRRRQEAVAAKFQALWRAYAAELQRAREDHAATVLARAERQRQARALRKALLDRRLKERAAKREAAIREAERRRPHACARIVQRAFRHSRQEHAVAAIQKAWRKRLQQRRGKQRGAGTGSGRRLSVDTHHRVGPQRKPRATSAVRADDSTAFLTEVSDLGA
jgi:hypothetical protein